MQIGVIGISHKEACACIRDQFSFTDTQKLAFYNELLDEGIHQAIVLTTCNRNELYYLYETPYQQTRAYQLFIQHADQQAIVNLYQKENEAAIIHLYEVCCGYHSMVLGEDEIAGQLYRAYEYASLAHACKKEFHQLFQSCFAVVKRLKTQHEFSQVPISIAYVATQMIQKKIEITNKTVMIIGSGSMASLMLTHIKTLPVHHIYLCNRTLAKAMTLVDDERIEVITFAKRYALAKHCDIIISATSSPHVIMRAEKFQVSNRNQVLVDLGAPHDLDDKLTRYEQITLFDIDALTQIAASYEQTRANRLEAAHDELLHEANSAYQKLQNKASDVLCASLQKRGIDMAEDTYQLLMQKLQLDKHEQTILKKVLQTSFLRLLKEPMIALKQADHVTSGAYQKVVQSLFQLEEDHSCVID